VRRAPVSRNGRISAIMMGMNQAKMYGDYDVVPAMWRISTLKEFQKAIERYIELLTPHKSEHNKQINKEIIAMTFFLKRVIETIAKGDGDFDTQEFLMEGKTCGKLHDILWKYNGWKDQLFREKERVTTIPAALEGDKKELETIREILQIPIWQQVTRHKILVENFSSITPPKTENPVMQQVINVQTLNGILAGTNNGTITQNNESKEVLKAIQDLAAILEERKINEQYTKEAFNHLQELQGELLKPYPDNSKLKQAGNAREH
jgi:hypothetical protein